MMMVPPFSKSNPRLECRLHHLPTNAFVSNHRDNQWRAWKNKDYAEQLTFKANGTFPNSGQKIDSS